MDRLMDGWMDGWMGRGMDGWIDGWMDELMGESKDGLDSQWSMKTDMITEPLPMVAMWIKNTYIIS